MSAAKRLLQMETGDERARKKGNEYEGKKTEINKKLTSRFATLSFLAIIN